MGHKWADCLHNPYLEGAPSVSKRGENQKAYYITPTNLGVPNIQKQETQSKVANKWTDCLHNPCPLGGAQRFNMGTKSEMADKWADWLHKPSWLGVSPTASERGTNSEMSHKRADWLHTTCRLGGEGGSPPLQSRGQNQHWRTSGRIGYITPAI